MIQLLRQRHQGPSRPDPLDDPVSAVISCDPQGVRAHTPLEIVRDGAVSCCITMVDVRQLST
jgi:hypothetical protein